MKVINDVDIAFYEHRRKDNGSNLKFTGSIDITGRY